MLSRMASRDPRRRASATCIAAGERSFSFEFFPPKDEAGERQLWQRDPRARAAAADVRLGDVRRRRLHPRPDRRGSPSGIAARDHADPDGAPDLRRPLRATSCARSSARTPTPASATCWRCAATRRTGPARAVEPHTEGGFDYAVELVELVRGARRLLRRRRGLPRGAPATRRRSTPTRACWPPRHEAGAEFAITQLFFRAADYFALVERARAAGVDIPIIPGIMPITNLGQIDAGWPSCPGATCPPRSSSRVAPLDGDPAAVRAEGIAIATELCDELLAGGAPGLHFYTLNRSKATREIYAGARASTRLTADGHSAGPDRLRRPAAAESPTNGSPAPGGGVRAGARTPRRSACAVPSRRSTVARPCQSTPYGDPRQLLDLVARGPVDAHLDLVAHVDPVPGQRDQRCPRRAGPRPSTVQAAPPAGARAVGAHAPASGRRAAPPRAAGRAPSPASPRWHDDRRDRRHRALDVRRQRRQPARVDAHTTTSASSAPVVGVARPTTRPPAQLEVAAVGAEQHRRPARSPSRLASAVGERAHPAGDRPDAEVLLDVGPHPHPRRHVARVVAVQHGRVAARPRAAARP